MTSEILSPESETTIVSSRVFHYPLSTLYKAWTTPKYLKEWWGPNGFTNTFHEYDLRPEGKWTFTMHGPDGKNYLNECIFLEIEPESRLVWNHLSNPQFQIQATFQQKREDQSEVVFRMVFLDEKLRDNLYDFIKEKNEENFERLAVVLEGM